MKSLIFHPTLRDHGIPSSDSAPCLNLVQQTFMSDKLIDGIKETYATHVHYAKRIRLANEKESDTFLEVVPEGCVDERIKKSDMLLYTESKKPTTDNVFLCQDCLRSLQKKQLPRLALANDLWIGHVPYQLDILTLPEHVLIARYFPAAYIVKLYPTIKNTRNWDSALFSSGMKGNISTYPLPHGK